MNDNMQLVKLACPRCGGVELSKNGWRFRGGQKIREYMCRNCGKRVRESYAPEPSRPGLNNK
jgi:transposase-like protein